MRSALSALAVAASAGVLYAQVPERALQQIRPELIRAHLQFLADDLLEGRGTGTRGYQLAANYVAAQFAALGMDPAFGQSFFQPVSLRHAEAIGNGSSLVFSRGRQQLRLTYAADFVTDGDIHRQAVSITAQIVFVGAGIAAPELGHDDYADVDVRGKIVAMLPEPIPKLSPSHAAYFESLDRRIEAAVERGAVGFLMLAPDNSFPWERNLQIAYQGVTSTTGAAGSPQQPSKPIAFAVLRFETTRRLLEMGSLDLERILSRHREGRTQSMVLPVTASMRIRSRHTILNSPNVGAVVRGADPLLKDEYVVYTAHLDHLGRGRPVNGDDIYNGALDNASGVAAMLAVARAVVSLPERPRRSILFLATTGEEAGMLGSKYFTAHPPVPPANIVAVVNIDGATLMRYPLYRVTARGGEHSTLGLAAERAARQLKVEITQADAGPIGSDHGPFLLRGIPVLWVTAAGDTGRPDIDGEKLRTEWMAQIYHTPKDDLNQPLDFGPAAAFAQLDFLIGYQVAQDDERPRWKPGDFFGEKFGGSRLK